MYAHDCVCMYMCECVSMFIGVENKTSKAADFTSASGSSSSSSICSIISKPRSAGVIE